MSEVKSKRIPSIEVLRSLAMFMVITMHYLDKGKVNISLGETQTIWSVLGWLLHSFCIVAVNCYVLISGYFLVESKFRWQKLVELVSQVLFYSILVPIVMFAIGILPASEISLYKLFLYVFPIHTEHYWFATSYIVMYTFSPLLAAGIKNMEKKSLQVTIAISLLLFSVAKTILPIQMEFDRFGYDALWFIILFMIAGYIRLYGIDAIKESKKGLIIYICGSFFTFVLAFAIRAISLRVGKMGYFITRTFDYNHLICLISSVALFLCFLYWNTSDNKLTRLAVAIGPYTFGVYLLHEQWEMRHVWPKLLQTGKFAGTGLQFFHWIISILIVFWVGIGVDFLRSKLFNMIKNKTSKELDK
ncbi:Surface polysaccharide O-acyltransferase, integral membrane enzyme [Lachnospiraceae bacterium G11]|nr:Surface polysaccharide O-acyltransferase, integral membrane enzyme [Lachnospiraceae bacterium G11]